MPTDRPFATPRLHWPVLRAYLLGWLPLTLVYMVATETDGDLSKGFHLWPALQNTALSLGPAVLLLALLWPASGWLDRRGTGASSLVLCHGLMAAVFSLCWHLCIYGLIWGLFGQAAADRARSQWFLWQGMQGMFMYWAVAGGFSAWRAVQRARHEAAASAQAQLLLARTELAALRNKLNPHFLFNTLHSIIALTRRDPARAEDALLRFADMLRYLLDTEKAGHDHVALSQELDFTRAYLALEALRLGARLTVDWQVDEALLERAVPALSVQPLVENSIQHAFNPRTAPGTLRISVRAGAAGQLLIGVADDGPGCEPEAWRQGHGLGLKTVARRLALEHGEAANLQVRTHAGAGFHVQLSLPAPTP